MERKIGGANNLAIRANYVSEASVYAGRSLKKCKDLLWDLVYRRYGTGRQKYLAPLAYPCLGF
jgi:hypothetical protein